MPIARGSVWEENTNFESDITSSVSEKYIENNPCDIKFQAAIKYLAIKQKL